MSWYKITKIYLAAALALIDSLFTVSTEGWMGKSQVNLQDIFLNQMRKEKIPVTMYLVNGARLTGTIKGFDNFVILMKQENQQLVYKHAISTIIPDRPVELVENVDMKKRSGAERGARISRLRIFESGELICIAVQLRDPRHEHAH